MLNQYEIHNQHWQSQKAFKASDPHLSALSKLKFQFQKFEWWNDFDPKIPGIYILTGGRQVGKSTSCKMLMSQCMRKKAFKPKQILYIPCDEIEDYKELSKQLHYLLDEALDEHFLLILDEITYVKDWDRTIKALADQGRFRKGICLLTGSDSIILHQAATRFPGRRGEADVVDFHLNPLSFKEYVQLTAKRQIKDTAKLKKLFEYYLTTGGYLKAINDLEMKGKITLATYKTYQDWIAKDFVKHGKNENTLLSILQAIYETGVSQISYTSLNQKIGLIDKNTCISYCELLERMGILLVLQAYDQNKKRGAPRKDRKFHFQDPFITHAIYEWLKKEGYVDTPLIESHLVEACVASHCHRNGKTFYFKGQGEIDVLWRHDNKLNAIEVKWTNQIKRDDMKMLKQFKHACILTKHTDSGVIDGIQSLSVYAFLSNL